MLTFDQWLVVGLAIVVVVLLCYINFLHRVFEEVERRAAELYYIARDCQRTMRMQELTIEMQNQTLEAIANSHRFQRQFIRDVRDRLVAEVEAKKESSKEKEQPQ